MKTPKTNKIIMKDSKLVSLIKHEIRTGIAHIFDGWPKEDCINGTALKIEKLLK